MKRRIMAMVLAFAMLAIILGGCGGKPAPTPSITPSPTIAATPAQTPSGEISAAISGQPETIDPVMNYTLEGGIYLVHLFEGLFRYSWDGSSKIEPGMAESYTISPDGLVWTFKIRSDAKWSDGKPVTAHDFVYSWKRLVDPAVAAPLSSDYGGYIKNGMAVLSGEKPLDELGVKAVDNTTLEVTLEQPCPYFNEICTSPVMYPVRQDTIEANGDKWTRSSETYITNGAFKMQSYTLDDSLVIVPNENYYDREKITPTKITFLFLADEAAMLAAFRSGEIQFADTYPVEDMESVKAEGVYKLVPQLGTYFVMFNMAKEPFDDVNVRKAFALAIDNNYIAASVRQGTVLPAQRYIGAGFKDGDGTTDFAEVGTKYIDPNNYENNKNLAKQALAEAGYPNGQGFPTVEYHYNTGAGHEPIAEALQSMWQDVLGVKVELVGQEGPMWQQGIFQGNFHATRFSWIPDYYDPSSMLKIFHSTSSINIGRYKNPEFDSLLDAAMKGTDRKTRIEALHDAEDILMGKDWALAPIYYYADEHLIDASLKNVGASPLGYKFFHMAYIQK